jgi:hypothetical protein
LLTTENPDEEEQELEEKISKFANQVSHKITGLSDDSQEVRKELNYKSIIAAKKEVC